MRISVALCTYNGEKFLNEQIDSILSQSISVDEIVVCDDCSTDSTRNILNSYKEKYPSLFKIYFNESNLKSVKNFEKAISLCENELIFLSDQDDIWVKNKVEKYRNYFLANPKIHVLCSNVFGIDDNGNIINVVTIWDAIQNNKKNTIISSYYDLISLVNNIATGATMAIRKEFSLYCMPFPDIENIHHDEWIALLSSLENKFEILEEKLLYYRQHNHQQLGGIFYPNTDKNKKRLQRFFNLEVNNKDFSNYKHILKRLSNSYKKNIALLNAEMKHKAIFEKNRLKIKLLFYTNRTEVKSKYPIRFFIQNIIDKIQNKRQLPDEK